MCNGSCCYDVSIRVRRRQRHFDEMLDKLSMLGVVINGKNTKGRRIGDAAS